MKFNPSRISVRHPKRLIIIIVSVLLVAALATYGVFSYLNWREFDQNSQKAATSLKNAIKSSLTSEKTAPEAATRIDTIVSDFTKTYGENPCQIPSWYNWQTVLPQLKTMQTSCDARFKAALAVIKTLKPLSQYLKDEKKAADLFTVSLQATKDSTDYTAAATIWNTASESADLSTNANFKGVSVKSTEIMTAISAAYTALATANTKENKADFDKASEELKTAYLKIDELKASVSTERNALIKAFITANEKL